MIATVIAGGDRTPKVTFNEDAKVLTVKGRSLPEDASSFYKPALEYLKDLSIAATAGVSLEVCLEYYNTSSSKMILEMMNILETMDEAKITWCFEEDDANMERSGKEYESLVNVTFEYSCQPEIDYLK